MNREKARDQDRFEDVRRSRLEAAGVLWDRDSEDEPRVEYLTGEIVTVAGAADELGAELSRLGNQWRRRDDRGWGEGADTPVIIEHRRPGREHRASRRGAGTSR